MFWLSAKVEWFCPFQGRLFFLFKMYLSHEALNLKRLNLLDRDLYQKTLRDLSSKSGRKQTCLSIPQTMGEIQVWCSLVCSVFIFLHLLVVISSFLVSAATAVMGKIIPMLFLLLASPFWVVPLSLTRVLPYWAMCYCPSAGAEYEGMPVVQGTSLGRFTGGSFSGNHGCLPLIWRALLSYGAAFSNLALERHPASANFCFCLVFWREAFWFCIMKRFSFS